MGCFATALSAQWKGLHRIFKHKWGTDQGQKHVNYIWKFQLYYGDLALMDWWSEVHVFLQQVHLTFGLQIGFDDVFVLLDEEQMFKIYVFICLSNIYDYTSFILK